MQQQSLAKRVVALRLPSKQQVGDAAASTGQASEGQQGQAEAEDNTSIEPVVTPAVERAVRGMCGAAAAPAFRSAHARLDGSTFDPRSTPTGSNSLDRERIRFHAASSNACHRFKRAVERWRAAKVQQLPTEAGCVLEKPDTVGVSLSPTEPATAPLPQSEPPHQTPVQSAPTFSMRESGSVEPVALWPLTPPPTASPTRSQSDSKAGIILPPGLHPVHAPPAPPCARWPASPDTALAPTDGHTASQIPPASTPARTLPGQPGLSPSPTQPQALPTEAPSTPLSFASPGEAESPPGSSGWSSTPASAASPRRRDGLTRPWQAAGASPPPGMTRLSPSPLAAADPRSETAPARAPTTPGLLSSQLHHRQAPASFTAGQATQQSGTASATLAAAGSASPSHRGGSPSVECGVGEVPTPSPAWRAHVGSVTPVGRAEASPAQPHQGAGEAHAAHLFRRLASALESEEKQQRRCVALRPALRKWHRLAAAAVATRAAWHAAGVFRKTLLQSRVLFGWLDAVRKQRRLRLAGLRVLARRRASTQAALLRSWASVARRVRLVRQATRLLSARLKARVMARWHAFMAHRRREQQSAALASITFAQLKRRRVLQVWKIVAQRRRLVRQRLLVLERVAVQVCLRQCWAAWCAGVVEAGYVEALAVRALQHRARTLLVRWKEWVTVVHHTQHLAREAQAKASQLRKRAALQAWRGASARRVAGRAGVMRLAQVVWRGRLRRALIHWAATTYSSFLREQRLAATTALRRLRVTFDAWASWAASMRMGKRRLHHRRLQAVVAHWAASAQLTRRLTTAHAAISHAVCVRLASTGFAALQRATVQRRRARYLDRQASKLGRAAVLRRVHARWAQYVAMRRRKAVVSALGAAWGGHRMASTALRTWYRVWKATAFARVAEQAALTLWRKHALRRCLAGMVAVTHRARADRLATRIASTHFSLVLLRKVFAAWAEDTFRIVRARAQVVCHARSRARLRTLRRALLGMHRVAQQGASARLALQRCIVSTRRKRAAVAVATWRRQTQQKADWRRQCTVARRHIARRRLARATRAWSTVSSTLRHEQQLVESATQHWRARHLGIAIAGWSSTVRRRQAAKLRTTQARIFATMRLGASVLKAWKAAAQRAGALRTTAALVACCAGDRRVSAALRRWRVALACKRRDRAQLALAAAHWRRACLRQGFFGWVESRRRCRRMHIGAELLASTMHRFLVGHALQRWCGFAAQTRKCVHKLAIAAAFHRRRVTSRAWMRWRGVVAASKIDALLSQAADAHRRRHLLRAAVRALRLRQRDAGRVRVLQCAVSSASAVHRLRRALHTWQGWTAAKQEGRQANVLAARHMSALRRRQALCAWARHTEGSLLRAEASAAVRARHQTRLLLNAVRALHQHAASVSLDRGRTQLASRWAARKRAQQAVHLWQRHVQRQRLCRARRAIAVQHASRTALATAFARLARGAAALRRMRQCRERRSRMCARAGLIRWCQRARYTASLRSRQPLLKPRVTVLRKRAVLRGWLQLTLHRKQAAARRSATATAQLQRLRLRQHVRAWCAVAHREQSRALAASMATRWAARNHLHRAWHAWRRAYAGRAMARLHFWRRQRRVLHSTFTAWHAATTESRTATVRDALAAAHCRRARARRAVLALRRHALKRQANAASVQAARALAAHHLATRCLVEWRSQVHRARRVRCMSRRAWRRRLAGMMAAWHVAAVQARRQAGHALSTRQLFRAGLSQWMRTSGFGWRVPPPAPLTLLPRLLVRLGRGGGHLGSQLYASPVHAGLTACGMLQAWRVAAVSSRVQRNVLSAARQVASASLCRRVWAAWTGAVLQRQRKARLQAVAAAHHRRAVLRKGTAAWCKVAAAQLRGRRATLKRAWAQWKWRAAVARWAAAKLKVAGQFHTHRLRAAAFAALRQGTLRAAAESRVVAETVIRARLARMLRGWRQVAVSVRAWHRRAQTAGFGVDRGRTAPWSTRGRARPLLATTADAASRIAQHQRLGNSPRGLQSPAGTGSPAQVSASPALLRVRAALTPTARAALAAHTPTPPRPLHLAGDNGSPGLKSHPASFLRRSGQTQQPLAPSAHDNEKVFSSVARRALASESSSASETSDLGMSVGTKRYSAALARAQALLDDRSGFDSPVSKSPAPAARDGTPVSSPRLQRAAQALGVAVGPETWSSGASSTVSS